MDVSIGVPNAAQRTRGDGLDQVDQLAGAAGL